jgi:hypothetical protein
MSSWPFRLAEKRLDGGEMCVSGRGINEQFSPLFADAVKPTRGRSPPLAGKAEKYALAARGGGGDSAFRPET